MKMIFNEEESWDVAAILAALDGFADSMGLETLNIHTEKIIAIAKLLRDEAVYKDGIEQASVFKKAASFITYFVGERPIPDPLPEEIIGKLAKINNHQNGYFALMYALKALVSAEIVSGESTKKIENPLELSPHSLHDIVDAVSRCSHQTGYHLVTVLLEQIVYKTNPDCQYKPIVID